MYELVQELQCQTQSDYVSGFKKKEPIWVISAEVCTTFGIRKKLGIEAKSAIGGELLNGNY